MAKKRSKQSKAWLKAERERKRIVAQNLRDRRKREKLAGIASNVIQEVAPSVINVAIDKPPESPLQLPLVESAVIIEPINNPHPTPLQLLNYAEMTSYGYDQAMIESRSRVVKAIADKLESESWQFKDSAGNDINFKALMEESRANRDGGLDLFIERGLRQRAANGDKQAIEKLEARVQKNLPKVTDVNKTPSDTINEIRSNDLRLILEKQSRNETLTESDRKMIREMRAELAASATPAKVQDEVQKSIENRLITAREVVYETLYTLMTTSKRDDVKMNAAVKLKEWADAEKPAEEAYTIADAMPKNEKIVSINEGIKVIDNAQINKKAGQA